jgi:hypothetical protein
MKRILPALILLISQISFAQVTVDWSTFPGGVSIATDLSNNVYTANWDYNPAGDITLTKRNASGVVLWNANYDNTDMTRHEVATWVAVDNSGNIFSERNHTFGLFEPGECSKCSDEI